VATTVYLNGKFTAQKTTGVQRVARCLVEALDRGLARGSAGPAQALRWVLLCPPGGRLPELRHVEPRVIGSGRGGLHVWEQWTLPRAARDGLLVNLAGSAPAWAGRQVCTFPADLRAQEALRIAPRLGDLSGPGPQAKPRRRDGRLHVLIGKCHLRASLRPDVPGLI